MFIGERPDWPTAVEFEAAGRHDLRRAVKRHGGAVAWAKRLGKQLRPGQDRTSYGEDDAMRDGLEIVDMRGHLPGAGEVRALGYHRLASFMQCRYPGGAGRFRADLTSLDPSSS